MNLPGSPFKGLAYFGDSELDWRFFFGRERESEIVAANLMASRLTVLYGPSGVGKSSLLRAGVARRLHSLVPAAPAEDQATAESAIVDRWRDDPLLALATAAGASTDIPLGDALAERTIASGAELYLMLDQMEEYVLYHGRDGGPLADALEDVLTRPDVPVHVLLGVRDDALADLDAFKRRLPGLFGNVLRLDHLTRAAARSAIEGPLHAYAELGGPKVSADDDFIEAVLDEVAAGRIEQQLSGRGLVDEAIRERRVEAPYLQLVLERLWEVERAHESDRLRAGTLAELGGAQQIVQEHLERALAGLDEEQRDLAARLFNHLVTPSGTKIAHGVGDLARYARSEPVRIEPVLGSLDGARILRRVPGRSGGPSRYEIFHDVLAPAVLAWRDRHEAERALAAERAEARRRHRRLAAIASLASVALAAMVLLTLYAFSTRERARDEATHAEARELIARAASMKGVDPELGLQLLLRSAAKEHSLELEGALRDALRDLRARRVLPGGGGSVTALDLSRDGRYALVASESGASRVLEAGSGRVVSEAQQAPITAAAFAPDGDSYAAGDERGSVRRWDTATGAMLDSFEVPAPVRGLAFSRNGRLLAAAGGQTAKVWRVSTGKLLADLPHAKPVDVVAFDPSGAHLLTVANDARIFDVGTGKRRALLDQPGQVQAAAFAPKGPLVVTGGRDDLGAIWNWRTGKLLHRLEGHGSDVTAVDWSPLGDLVATASSDSSGRIWRAADGALVSLLAAHVNAVTDIAFSPDETSVATSSLDGSGRIWSNASFARSGALLGHSAPAVRQVRFTPDGGGVLTGSDDGTARLWRSNVDPVSAVVGKHRGPGRAVAFSPDGSLLASVGLDRTLRLWLGRTLARMIVLPADAVDVAFSPAGDVLATADAGGHGRLWRVGDGSALRSFDHGAPLRAIAFDRGGRRVVTGGEDGKARIWSIETGATETVLDHGAAVTGVAFSPDGSRVATAGADHAGTIWRLSDGKPIGRLVGHEHELTSIAFSPSGRQLVTASIDADARLWSASTFRTLRVLRGHAAVVSEAVYSPDGRWVATAGPTTIGVWDTVTGRRIESGLPPLYVRGHRKRVRSVAFGPDSRRLASTGDDGTVRSYRCELCGTTEELVGLARRRLDQLGSNLTPAERQRYLGGR
jgi:WD40 repeat protein